MNTNPAKEPSDDRRRQREAHAAVDPSSHYCYGGPFIPSLLFIFLLTIVASPHLHADAGLVDSSTKGEVAPDTEKLIVLIHGWNPSTTPKNMFSGGEFKSLIRNLKPRVARSEWILAEYQWENDASTGWASPIEAANNANVRGSDLGQQLARLPDLRQVHFIAHSAGSWAARTAGLHLMQVKGNAIKIQITLLDPFIPGAINTFASLKRESISDINNSPFATAANLFLLENYFANDIIVNPLLLNPFDNQPNQAASIGTEGDFDWRSTDVNQRVDWLHVVDGVNTYYDFHAGPIRFYSDTIVYSDISPVGDGLQNPEFDISNIGWRRSMFFREPAFVVPPGNITVDIGEDATFTVVAARRGISNQSPLGLTLQWEVKAQNGSWANIGNRFTSLAIANTTSNQSGNLYRAIATLDGLSTVSQEAKLTVRNAQVGSPPAAPTGLAASAAPGTQINLSWTYAPSNEAGFKIERRLGSAGSWSQIAMLLNDVRNFSNTGLSPDTSYWV